MQNGDQVEYQTGWAAFGSGVVVAYDPGTEMVTVQDDDDSALWTGPEDKTTLVRSVGQATVHLDGQSIMNYRRVSPSASCIGCGCHDLRACEGGCWWLRVDYAAAAGVCSECESHAARWDAGDRSKQSGEP